MLLPYKECTIGSQIAKKLGEYANKDLFFKQLEQTLQLCGISP